MKCDAFFLICLCAASFSVLFTSVCDFIFCCCLVLLYCCLVMCFLQFCLFRFALISPFCPFSVSSYLLTFFRLVLAALSAFNLSYEVLFCSCRYRLPLCVTFSLRFLRVVFCRSLFLSRFSALRVSPAETRLTVYRRLSILVQYQSVGSWVSHFFEILQFFVLIKHFL